MSLKAVYFLQHDLVNSANGFSPLLAGHATHKWPWMAFDEKINCFVKDHVIRMEVQTHPRFHRLRLASQVCKLLGDMHVYSVRTGYLDLLAAMVKPVLSTNGYTVMLVSQRTLHADQL